MKLWLRNDYKMIKYKICVTSFSAFNFTTRSKFNLKEQKFFCNF